ncbi:MAG: nuclear transport factor 2 family protein [Chloroflexi bacterium]|nr:nuclear transport factor 2 family protein [Chloroflexota bacterium]MBV9596193.1 nuclear transport factor 2 family protein [Chloroflexota bacterium]
MTDEDAIRNTIARFCQCLDSRQFEAWSQTFTEAGKFGRLEGRAAILEMILGGELAKQPDLKRQHAVTNSVIDIHGDIAESTSDLTMYDRVGDGPISVRIGRYYDKLARQPDGTWLFTERRLEWRD